MDPVYKLAVETIQASKQAIIFVPSRASAEKTAEEIAKLTSLQLPELEQGILGAATSTTKQCERLGKCVRKGIAFHHAGLMQKQRDLIEDEFKKGVVKVICATPTLCLSGDTEIWQPSGNTLAKNFSGSKPLFALSQSNRLQVMKSKKVIKNLNSVKLVEISSVSGYTIKLTPNHKILVKRKGKKQLTEASKCKTGDKIATCGKISFSKTIRPKVSNFVKDNPLPINDRELTENEFYFIGSMLGDGHSGSEIRGAKILYKGSPTFTSSDLESIELIELIAKSFDSFSKRRHRHGSISLVLTKKKWFREFLCKAGVDIGINKSISPFLLQADLNLLGNLIQGLFDTDGCIERNRNLAFSNISIKLIKDLQKSLLRFGIVSRVRKRKGKPVNITQKTYQSKDIYELVIDQTKCILLFHKHIGFKLQRKQRALEKLVAKISHVLYSECKECKYKVYSNLLSGRTQEQKEWGRRKKKVIEFLGKQGETGSRVIEKKLGFLPRHPKGNRLNHHYEFITKRKIGKVSKTEWFWSLNLIGSWIYWRILKKNKNMSEFFNLAECPICRNKLNKKLRKKWRDSDFDGDIFWDYVRYVKEVDVEKDVYDIVLPNKPANDHMFVANGFIVHNSAGLSLPVFRVIIKSLKRYSGRWGMDWIPVLEYLQMAGRAGRPEYEKFGEAICIAMKAGEKDEIYDRYILGEPEDIYSKLAVEPVLRTYVLSLIASGVITDSLSMEEFFSKTFWAYQFRDMAKLKSIMEKMVRLLEEWEFIKVVGGGDFVAADAVGKTRMVATPVGRRVSELYLDPLTARHLLDCLQKYKEGVFSLLMMISDTLEMRPLLRVKASEEAAVQEQLVERYELLLQEEPSAYDLEYGEFLNAVKTALFFEAWIEEKDENYLLEKFGIRPGETRYKITAADWLLYASEELSNLLGFRSAVKDIRKLRVRVKHGVREELLVLLKLKGIGRVRARKMFMNGLRNVGDLVKVDFTSLSQILGPKVAADVKKQVGEEVKVVPKGTRKGQLSIDKFVGK